MVDNKCSFTAPKEQDSTEQTTSTAKSYSDSITIKNSADNRAPELVIEEDEPDEDGDDDDDIDNDLLI